MTTNEAPRGPVKRPFGIEGPFYSPESRAARLARLFGTSPDRHVLIACAIAAVVLAVLGLIRSLPGQA